MRGTPWIGYVRGVDPLDLDEARSTPPGVKLAQALELMEMGIRLKRAALRERHPEEDEAGIDALLDAWLEAKA